jgi:D-glycero-alpha-D-manno-heptose-7-phosphate kinase
MVIRSRAPLRISFSGGGTDVMPYLAEHGGCVLSTTIDHYTYATIRPAADRTVTLRSLDFDMTVKHHMTEQPLPYDGNLDLVKAVVNRLHLPELRDDDEGVEIFLHSDAPPGSGLGSSSSLVVALVGLFRARHRLALTAHDVADLAYQIEREDMGIKGGKQDHYAAAFGGFNFIEFGRDTTVVHPLRIDADIQHELHYNLLLCYTGATRLSSGIIDRQVQNVVEQRADVLAAMDEMKQITVALKNALLRGRLDEFGGLLDEAWMRKKRMADLISSPRIEAMYHAARHNGALGGKVTGAGGGGYMLFYCPFETRRRVAEALEAEGAQVVGFNFDSAGLQTWSVR